MTLLVVFLLFVFFAVVLFAIAAALVFMLALGPRRHRMAIALGIVAALVGAVA